MQVSPIIRHLLHFIKKKKKTLLYPNSIYGGTLKVISYKPKIKKVIPSLFVT